MVISFILAFLLFLSVALNFSSLARFLPESVKPMEQGGPRLEEVLLRGEAAARQKIAVIDVRGIITGRSLDGSGFSLPELIKSQFERARKDPKVRAVILRVDSPGGEVLAADTINRTIAKFEENSSKPVIVSMGDLAASGGYYVSAPCRWIVANELTITGSIGVIMSTYNYRGLMDKVGLKPVVYKSGRFKNMLSGSRLPAEIPDEERAMVQSLIDETFQKFKSVVREGRGHAAEENQSAGRQLSSDWESYADGRILTGNQAYELGFVDELGDFDTAIARAKKLAQLDAADLVQYRQVLDLSDLFSLFGKSEAKSVKIDWGIALPKLQSGQPYYLAPTFLQ